MAIKLPNIFLQAGIGEGARQKMKEAGLAQSAAAEPEPARQPSLAEMQASFNARSNPLGKISFGVLEDEPLPQFDPTGKAPQPLQGAAPAAPAGQTPIAPDDLQSRERERRQVMLNFDDLRERNMGIEAAINDLRGVGVRAGENPYAGEKLQALDDEAAGAVEAREGQRQANIQDAALRDQVASLQRARVPDEAGQAMAARQRAMRAAQDLDTASKTYRDAVMNGVDPDRLYGSGRLNKAMVFAAFLGNSNQVYSTGVQPPDTMALMQQLVENDIRDQEMDIQTKGDLSNSLLAQLQVALGDKEAAKQAFRLIWDDMVASQLETMIPRIADAQQQAALVNHLGELQNKRADFLVKFTDDQLNRELDANKATARNLTTAAGERAKLSLEGSTLDRKDYEAMDKYVSDHGTQVEALQKTDSLLTLMNEAQQKFGHIPGLGNLVLGKPVDVVRRYLDQLRGGASLPGINTQDERRYAIDIMQKALEWETVMAQAIKGTPSDYDVARYERTFGLTGSKDEKTAMQIIKDFKNDTVNGMTIRANTGLTPLARLHLSRRMPWFQERLPEGVSSGDVYGTRYKGQQPF